MPSQFRSLVTLALFLLSTPLHHTSLHLRTSSLPQQCRTSCPRTVVFLFSKYIFWSPAYPNPPLLCHPHALRLFQGGCITVERGLEGFRAFFASPSEVTLRFFADNACDDGEQRYTQLSTAAAATHVTP